MGGQGGSSKLRARVLSVNTDWMSQTVSRRWVSTKVNFGWNTRLVSNGRATRLLMKPCKGVPLVLYSSLAELKCKSRKMKSYVVPTGDQLSKPCTKRLGHQVQKQRDIVNH